MLMCAVQYFGFFYIFFCRVSIKDSSVAKLGSVCRRVYRIFSHAYFHHRALFDEYEVSFNRPCSAAFPWPALCHIHQAVLSYSLLELCSVCTPLSPFLIRRMFVRKPSWKYSVDLVGS